LVIELEDRKGSKMTLRLAQSDSAAALALAHGLWRQVCRQRLNLDPIVGALFVFSNRRRRALKILMYDGQGCWLCQKRLSQGRFGW
jgi:transposase